MSARKGWLAAVAVAAMAGLAAMGGEPAGAKKAAPAGAAAPAPRLDLSEPIAHENLTLFMVYGPDRVKGGEFLTLKEAMDAKLVVVHETGNVGELTIQNTGDKPVYIQSGEIVKGGRQDRTLQWDMLLPPKSDKLPIRSFCVESGRWSQRGGENPAQFGSADKMLATKELKLAARSKGDQGEVWKEVANAQKKLSDSTGTNVAAPQSASSLQLALENKDVQAKVGEFVKKLSAAPRGEKNVIGFAFAINGKVNSIDVYGNAALFAKLWPKLLEAAATEAVAKQQKDAKFSAARAADVQALVDEAARAKAEDKDIATGTKARVRENDKAAYYGTRAPAAAAEASVHESYIKK